jgi:hypothetical protein
MYFKYCEMHKCVNISYMKVIQFYLSITLWKIFTKFLND